MATHEYDLVQFFVIYIAVVQVGTLTPRPRPLTFTNISSREAKLQANGVVLLLVSSCQHEIYAPGMTLTLYRRRAGYCSSEQDLKL